MNTLLDSDPIPFEVIAMLWEDDPLSDGELSLRTFHEHRKGIKELFGIDIVCDKSNGFCYSVRNPEVLSQKRLPNWLLKAYSVPEGFATYRRMYDRVLLEEVPKGKEYLDPILDALQRDVILLVDYQNYEGPHELFNIHPYALKIYSRQWFLLGYIEERKAIGTITLNLIIDLEQTGRTFVRPKDFDARKYFSNTVGIPECENLPVEKVRIRTYGLQMKYLRSVPLHKSQEEVLTRNGDFADFQYKLCITPELVSALLSKGNNVEVLEPESLRLHVIRQLEESRDRYLHSPLTN